MRSFLRAAPLVIVIMVMFMLPFGLGYVVGQRDLASAVHTPVQTWLATLHLIPPPGEAATAPSPELNDLFKPFWEAWDYVDSEYYAQGDIDHAKLEQEALRGMVASLGDPFTLYLDPQHRQMTESDLSGAFDGIGVEVEMDDGRLTISSAIAGSPGEQAGLQAGDVIVQVDGKPLGDTSLTDAIQLIRGPRGSTVTLTIDRGGHELDVPVQRGQIDVPAVQGHVDSDGIAYLSISSFTQRVGSDMSQQLTSLNTQDPKGWVLDLRNNPGGYLDGAIAITSAFVPDGTVLFEEQRGGQRVESHTRGQALAAEGPMVVLVDKNTASAAEIVAAALHDDGRATVVGSQTFGKGSVQLVHELSDGGALRITVAHWLTPHGDSINGVGLAPDVPVDQTSGPDATLSAGLDLVRQRIAAAGEPTPATAMASGTPVPSGPADATDDPGTTMNVTNGTDAQVAILGSAERAKNDPNGLV